MSEKEKLILEIKKQIELLKQEIADKRVILSTLIEQLTEMEEENNE